MAMTPKEQLEILAAYISGEVIQYQPKGASYWVTVISGSTTYQFDFESNKYRPKPKPLELWFNVYPEPRSSVPHAIYTSEDDAIRFRGANGRTVHMREVVDD